MESKKILLIVVVFVLIGSVGYLGYLLQDGTNPLLIFNTRAAEDTETPDFDPTDDVTALVYNSTSPTATPSGNLSPTASVSATLSPSPTVSLTQTPTTTAVIISPSPTVITSLPVAGITDNLHFVILGGGALVLLALLL